MAYWRVIRTSDCRCSLQQFSGLASPETEGEKEFAKGEFPEGGVTEPEVDEEESRKEPEVSAASSGSCSVWMSQPYTTRNLARQARNQLQDDGFCK